MPTCGGCSLARSTLGSLPKWTFGRPSAGSAPLDRRYRRSCGRPAYECRQDACRGDRPAHYFVDHAPRPDRDASAGLVGSDGTVLSRLLVMRPFVPDRKNAMPADWKSILKQWVSGAEVSEIGPHNMRMVEEAFTYRLVWALEAIRTRRMSLDWSADIIPGGGAASLETGVPQFMMSLLIRAGLPSRRAAMAAVRAANPVFVTPAEMRGD